MQGTCPRNPRKKWFGFVSYEGEHGWDEHSLWRAADNAYTLVMECRLCGARQDFLLSDADMLRRGFVLEKLRTLKPMSMENPVPSDKLDEYHGDPAGEKP